MPRLIWSNPALADLQLINIWLEENASSALAIATLVKIGSRADCLKEFRHAGRPSEGSKRVLRVLSTPYLIIYRLGRDTVENARIRDEREDRLVQP